MLLVRRGRSRSRVCTRQPTDIRVLSAHGCFSATACYTSLAWEYTSHPTQRISLVPLVRTRHLSYVYVSIFQCPQLINTRLRPDLIPPAMSTHGQEYGEWIQNCSHVLVSLTILVPLVFNSGFPSSHSTNSVSIALFLGSLLAGLQDSSAISQPALYMGWTGKSVSQRTS